MHRSCTRHQLRLPMIIGGWQSDRHPRAQTSPDRTPAGRTAAPLLIRPIGHRGHHSPGSATCERPRRSIAMMRSDLTRSARTMDDRFHLADNTQLGGQLCPSSAVPTGEMAIAPTKWGLIRAEWWSLGTSTRTFCLVLRRSLSCAIELVRGCARPTTPREASPAQARPHTHRRADRCIPTWGHRCRPRC
jgi:hypothetical protein